MLETMTSAPDEGTIQQQKGFKKNIATIKTEALLSPRLIGRIFGTSERQVLLWLGRHPAKVDRTTMLRAESLIRRIRNLGASSPCEAYQIIAKTDKNGASLIDSWICDYTAVSILDKPRNSRILRSSGIDSSNT